MASPAIAQETGTISGIVFNQDGTPVAGVAVRVSGERLPAGRPAQTDANGLYRFDYLLPGQYTLEVLSAAGADAKYVAIVEIGRDTQLDLVLGVALTENLTVSAARPIVDVRSTEVSVNVLAGTLNSLPLERTYKGLFQLIPGVSDNRSPVGPSAGGTRQDNTYLVDGANITNPGFGHLGTEVNELDIAEVNLKRAGMSAEFGRTGGSVVNAVSRSGTNRFSGIGRIDWLPESLVGAYRLPDDLLSAGIRPGTFRDPLLTTQIGPALGIGGPIIRDHAFFYGSARSYRQAKWGRVNRAGTALPDEVRTATEFFAKLTAVPTPAHQINVSYRVHPSEVENASLDSTTAPGVATVTDNGNRVGSANWAYFLSARNALNVRYLHLREKNEDTPVTNLGYLPPFTPGNLSAMGQYTDPAQADLKVGGYQFANVQNYRRHELQATFSQYFDLGATSHALRVGGGYEFAEEQHNRLANGWGIIAAVTTNGVPGLRARYYTPQAPQLGQGRTHAFFVQDDVTIGARTSVTAGLLLTRDVFSQRVDGSGGCPATVVLRGGAAIYESEGDTCHFLRFGFGDEIQPRLGVSYQLREGAGDKVHGSWGRYYNMDQKSSGRSLAPTRIFQTQTIFDLNGNVLSSGPLASTTGKMIDPALEPTFTDEFVVGYATPLSATSSLDVFFMSRTTSNFIEDVPSRRNGTAPDAGPYVAANLPCAAFVACQSAHAERSYRAATIAVKQRLARGWTGDVSYTWSRFEGNVDLDYALVGVFNTSSIIQDAPGTSVEDPNRFGPLFEDRPHVFKVFTTYAPTGALTVSGYLRVQSGTPWAARGRDWAGTVLNYLEPAGSHRNPAWTNLDLMASYRLPLTGRASVSLEARLLNAFDTQTRLATDSQQFLDLNLTAAPPYFAPYQQPNPFFGSGNQFAPPRRLFLATTVTF